MKRVTTVALAQPITQVMEEKPAKAEVLPLEATTLRTTPIEELLTQRATLKATVAETEAQVDLVSGRIEKLMRLHKVTAVRVGDWQPHIVSKKGAERLDKKLLVVELVKRKVKLEVVSEAMQAATKIGEPSEYFTVFDCKKGKPSWLTE